MGDLRFDKGYRENDVLRASFNNLASEIFGINFEYWYQKGYWTDKYEPYSLIDENTVAANVSINKINMLIDNKPNRAIQIGTVMTHPDYRNRGLSRLLMEKVLEEYKDFDLMYLFANSAVLDFYPKFGFRAINEHQYFVDYEYLNSSNTNFRKLDVSNKEDLTLIYNLASEREPVSKDFGTSNTEELLMFYCLHVFSEDIYYFTEESVIVLAKNEGNLLHIFDVINKEEVNIDHIVNRLSNTSTKRIIFHYTPDYKELNIQRKLHTDSNVLFVKSNHGTIPDYFKHPLTSQA